MAANRAIKTSIAKLPLQGLPITILQHPAIVAHRLRLALGEADVLSDVARDIERVIAGCDAVEHDLPDAGERVARHLADQRHLVIAQKADGLRIGLRE